MASLRPLLRPRWNAIVSASLAAGLALAGCSNFGGRTNEASEELLLVYVGRQNCQNELTELVAFDLRCPVPPSAGTASAKLTELKLLRQQYPTTRKVCDNFSTVDRRLSDVSQATEAGETRGVLEATYLRGKIRLYCGRDGWESYVDAANRRGFETGNDITTD